MKKTLYLVILTFLYSQFAFVYSQNSIRGIVVDSVKLSALPYANIVVKHKSKGSISNETGFFSLKTEGLNSTDTISFQFVGYKTRCLTLAELDTFNYINLQEDIYNLAETFVFANPKNAEEIVEAILENKDKNYKRQNLESQIFVRTRDQSDITDFDVSLKRNSFPDLNKRLLDVFEKYIPKHNLSYTDFLGQLYQSEGKKDTIKLKPTRTVALKEKEISELEEIGNVFEKMFNNTKDKEYWKIKSGIIGQKMDIDDNTKKKDSLGNTIEKDSTELKALENTRSMSYFSRNLSYHMKFASFNNENQWDFLHNTKHYNYKLEGGTRVAGEDVYIIEFTPKKQGKFYGKMYVSISNYALIRADYTFADGKRGMHFQMFGVGYTVNAFSGSIFFEKQNDTYALKYFSVKEGTSFRFDRPVSLLKKRKRMLIDKKLFEIKVNFIIDVQSESLTEFLVLNRKDIPASTYKSYTPPKRIKMIYVDQFDEQLWKDYPIIEPTKQMRIFKKLENNF